MTFDQIFEAYYNLYRTEAETPDSSDDEYTVALRLANEAINRWENYDNTYWKELFVTLGTSTAGGETVLAASQTEYGTPDDMREPGGYVIVRDSSGSMVGRYPILEPQDAQFKSDNSKFAYFTGDPNNGFILHLNPAPTSSDAGKTIDYVYYRKATVIEDGNTVVDMTDPYFIVHRMLSNRFRGSRDPYCAAAKQDAENALQMMQMNNNSGTWANPWSLADNSGASWGL